MTGLREFLLENYDPQQLKVANLFDLWDREIFSRHIRSLRDTYTLQLKKDLGYYMRRRFATYPRKLRAYANEYGVRDTPFLVNIHGTGAVALLKPTPFGKRTV